MVLIRLPWRRQPETLTARLPWWESDGAARAPEEEKVAALERCYGIILPEDFRHYLVHHAPLGMDFDDDATWWSLDHIRNIPDELGEPFADDGADPEVAREAGAYLFFADYLVWCYAWAICCSDGPNRGRIALIGGPDRFVADSFTGFMKLYLADSKVIHA